MPLIPLREVAIAAALALLATAPARAVEIDTGSDLKLRWDNTVKYSIGSRLSSPNLANTNPNTDDSTRNFDKGALITNRLDLLSEMDLRYGRFGVGLSGAAWYDDVYNRHNDNTSQATYNPISVPVGTFPGDVKNFAGRHAEIRNAFVKGQFDAGDVPLTVRLGRHTLLWGESLFFTDNGIAAAMAPVDAYTALSVPGIQAKEVFMPVSQVSATALLPSGVTLEGYYQLEYRKTRIPAAETFFMTADLLDVGGERIVGPGFVRGGDHRPKKPQFGASLRWRPQDSAYEFGFHAIQYNDKVPQVIVQPVIGQYSLAYKEGIQLYGVSTTTSIGATNIGAEVSYRRGVPLVGNGNAGLVLPPDSVTNGRNVPYPLGDTLHLQASAIYVGNAGFAWDNLTVAGEVAGQHRVRTTHRPDLVSDAQDKNALGVRGVATFDYFQVAPALDLSVPITLGHNLLGRSPIQTSFNTYGSHHGGDISIGLNAVYRQQWRGGLNLTRFYGRADENAYRDRSFISANIQTTF